MDGQIKIPLAVTCLFLDYFTRCTFRSDCVLLTSCVCIKLKHALFVTFLEPVLVDLTCTDLTSMSPSSFPLIMVLLVPLILSALCRAYVCQSVQYIWMPTMTSPYGWGTPVTTTCRSFPDRSQLSMVLRCPSFQYKRPAGLSIASPLGQPKRSDIKARLKQEIIIGKVVQEPVYTDWVQSVPKSSNKIV